MDFVGPFDSYFEYFDFVEPLDFVDPFDSYFEYFDSFLAFPAYFAFLAYFAYLAYFAFLAYPFDQWPLNLDLNSLDFDSFLVDLFDLAEIDCS